MLKTCYFAFFAMIATQAVANAQTMQMGTRAGVTRWFNKPLDPQDYRAFYHRSRLTPATDIFFRRVGNRGWGVQLGLSLTRYEHDARYHVWDAPDHIHSTFYLYDPSVTLLRDISLNLAEKIFSHAPKIKSYVGLSVSAGPVYVNEQWIGYSSWSGDEGNAFVRYLTVSPSVAASLEHSISISNRLSAESWLGYRLNPIAGGNHFPDRFPMHRLAWLLGVSYRL